MNKRAVFYTIDAIVFASLIMAGIFLIPVEKNSETAIFHPTTFVSNDMVGVLGELKVYEVNQTWVTPQILDGNITHTNNSVLNQIGELWSDNNLGVAYELSSQVIGDLFPEHVGDGVWVNQEMIFTTPNPPTAHVVSGWRVISGIEKDKPVWGFVARARATNVRENSTRIISISPEGAGWNRGNVEITKYFNLSDLIISEAALTMSVHADTSNNDVRVNFNNGLCTFTRDDFTWLFGSEGNVGTRNVAGCLVNGVNKFLIYLNNNGYNAHTHPGMNLRINYTGQASLEPKSVDVSKRFYFDNIRSTEVSSDRAGVWSSFPFYIPENATNVNVTAQIVANNVRDYTGSSNFNSWSGWRRRRDYDYILFLNDNSPIDSDNHPDANPIYNYDMDDFKNDIVSGTNIISVYFNNYGDYVWGQDWVEIYSDQFNDPSGSSYVEVNYTDSVELPYGMIEISDVQPFGGASNRDKTTSFNFPAEAVLKGDVYAHVAQRYSFLVTIWGDTFNPPSTQVFRSPSSRAVPTTTFIDSEIFALSSMIDNYVRVRDDNNGNDIIASASNIEYHFYIPSFVGYGDVFATENEALSDALDRLNTTVGAYLEMSGITTDFDSITEVPTLWGPAAVEVRAWK